MRSNRGAFVVVGPMGAGKTTVGQALAEQLGRDHIDADRELERRCGADISWIFDIEGESGFRKRETAVLADLLERNNVLISTGGGVVLKPENRRMIRKADMVVYLTAAFDVLFARVQKDGNRPLLKTENPRQAYATLLAERDPLYREVADLVIEGESKMSPTAVARRIVQALQHHSR
ncbi:MAG: shikimate kinase [Cellvibrionales bacterium]|nr:shikimate kinase [Cellvibrionales bacterium]